MKLLEIVHPAAKLLVEIARSQDAEVGDGTTSVVLLAGEMLKESKPFVEDGVHPRVIIHGLRTATDLAVKRIREKEVEVNVEDDEFLMKCAETSLNSKLVARHKDMFAEIAVKAIRSLDPSYYPLNMIGIKLVPGGALTETQFVDGVAFKKTFSYAGFEMQRKSYNNPKIAMLNIELELKAERDNAEVRLTNVEDYQAVVDAEWQILYDKLDTLHKAGANVVLSKLPIGDVATQFFADRDMFCAGRVPDEDLTRTMKACGGAILTSVKGITEDKLGKCELFREDQVGGDRYNILTGCPQSRTCTLILRGGALQFLEETERSLHDAIMIVKRTLQHKKVVAGGGAIEMNLSKYLRAHSRTISGKQQMIIGAYAKALEVIPRQLCENAGLDSIDILNKLRQKHAQSEHCWSGVNVLAEKVDDNFEQCVLEPSLVKINALRSASEAACIVLGIDETIKNEQSDAPSMGGGGRGRGRGRPM